MGASKVVMLGIDFSFHIPKKSKDSSKEIMSEGEVNHFHKNYRKPEKSGMSQILIIKYYLLKVQKIIMKKWD